MSLAPNTVAEAEAMHAAALDYARPTIEAAAQNMAIFAGDIEEMLAHIPDGVGQRVDMEEVAKLLRRYAARLGAAPSPDAIGADQVLGVARRSAITAINRDADRRVDALVTAWAGGLDLPVMETSRIIDAALAAGVALAHKRAIGAVLTEAEAMAELGFQVMQERSMAIRAAQRDHVRSIDTISDVADVQAYPAGAVWPNG